MKKRLFCLVLCCFLVFSAVALASPGEETYTANVLAGLRFSGDANAVWGDTVYLAGKDKLYGIAPGQSAPQEYALTGYLKEAAAHSAITLAALFVQQDGLYTLVMESTPGEKSYPAYGFEQAVICRLVIAGDTADSQQITQVDPACITWKDDMGTVPCDVYGYAFESEKLYLLCMDEDFNSYLASVDCQSGQSRRLSVKEPQGMLGYKDGQLLIMKSEGSKVTFSAFDVKTEKLTLLAKASFGGYAASGLAYDPATDSLYYNHNRQLYRVQGMDFDAAQLITDIPVDPHSYSTAYLLQNGQLYAGCGSSTFAIRSTDPASRAETVLKVVTSTTFIDSINDAAGAFMNAHPEVSVALVGTGLQEWSLLNSLVTQDSEADIYITVVNSADFEAAYRRGYMAPIQSDTFVAQLQQMPPAFSAFFAPDGQALCCPVSVGGYAIGINKEALAACGASESDIPTTWVEFCAWLNSLAGKMPQGYSIFPIYTDRESEKNVLVNTVLRSAQSQGIGYDDPLLESALRAVEGLDLAGLGVPEKWPSAHTADAVQLFETEIGVTPGSFREDCVPFTLSFGEWQTGVYPVSMRVAFINPFSTQQALASQYLETLLSSLGAEDMATFYPFAAAPCRPAGYENDLAECSAAIAALTEQKTTAAAEAGRSIEDALAQAKQQLAQLESTWRISPASVQWYQQNADKMTVKRYSPIGVESQNVYPLIRQLAKKEITLDAFLKQLRQVEKMVKQEEGE